MIEKLELPIEDKAAESPDIIKKTEVAQEEIKTMTSRRQEENDEFKQAKKDDEAAIVCWRRKNALSKYYKET